MDSSDTTLTYRRLRPNAPVGLLAKACLELHPRGVSCARCLEACPVGVLHFTDAGMELADGCLGCGRCMAVCPNGAISVHGFSPTLIPETTLEALTLECWSVPSYLSPPGAVRVPCLGGLNVSQLLALRYVAGNRPLVLLDRGWCDGCPAGGPGLHPVHAVLSTTCRWLEQISAPATHWPALTRNPLPVSSRRQAPPDDTETGGTVNQDERVSRLARDVAATVLEIMRFRLGDHGTEKPVRPVNSLAPVHTIERDRQLLILERLAARYGGPVPPGLFPTVEIGPACRNHRLCASLCPTAALTPRENPRGGVAFEATACIACGQCERVCPEHAVRLSRQNSSARSPEKSMAPVFHGRQTCMDCSGTFAADGRKRNNKPGRMK